MILFCAKSKNNTGKKYVRKCREETLGLGQVFRPAGKIPRMFSDIRQSYLISFYPMCTCMREMRYVIACDCIYRMPQMRDISCDKCDIGRMRQIRYISHMRYRIAYTPSPPPPDDNSTLLANTSVTDVFDASMLKHALLWLEMDDDEFWELVVHCSSIKRKSVAKFAMCLPRNTHLPSDSHI